MGRVVTPESTRDQEVATVDELLRALDYAHSQGIMHRCVDNELRQFEFVCVCTFVCERVDVFLGGAARGGAAAACMLAQSGHNACVCVWGGGHFSNTVGTRTHAASCRHMHSNIKPNYSAPTPTPTPTPTPPPPHHVKQQQIIHDYTGT